MAKQIVIHRGSIPTPAPNHILKSSLEGKTVFFRVGGNSQDIAGVVKSVDGSLATVRLAIPNAEGVLVVSKDAAVQVQVEDLRSVEAVVLEGRNVKRWDTSNPVEGSKATEVKDAGGNVIDYRDVSFDGFGSTFKSETPEDRDGDYIMPGAFTKSLNEFKANPVMLTDHQRSVRNLMGSYSKIGTNGKGLTLTGEITNSQTEDARHVRALVSEGHLKTLSIGGMFFYEEDFKGINEIKLYEISLVVVPANPDATFQVRDLTTEIAQKAFQHHAGMHGGEVRCKIDLGID